MREKLHEFTSILKGWRFYKRQKQSVRCKIKKDLFIIKTSILNLWKVTRPNMLPCFQRCEVFTWKQRHWDVLHFTPCAVLGHCSTCVFLFCPHVQTRAQIQINPQQWSTPASLFLCQDLDGPAACSGPGTWIYNYIDNNNNNKTHCPGFSMLHKHVPVL